MTAVTRELPATDRDAAIQSLAKLLEHYLPGKPIEVTVRQRRAKRSNEQNRLQFLWCSEAAEQLQDGSVEDYRAYCKLHHGIPILRAEDESFREQYDRVVRPLDYERKLALMKAPFDFPVSRLMNVKQEQRYLDEICRDFCERGVQLTDPSREE